MLQVHTDHLGTPRAVSNSNNEILWRWEGDQFGDVEPQIATITMPLRHAGQYHDKETNLFYNYFRFYDPKTGRYVTSDPIGLEGGMNTYGYVGADPLYWIDPYGLYFGYDDAAFAVGGAAVGIIGRAVVDIATGEVSSFNDYAGAAVGGAAGGMVLLYTANPFLAGAAAGATGNVITQGLNIATDKQCSFNANALVVDTTFGAATGFIPGKPRISGINAGRGSDVQVFRQIRTKAKNGTIKRIKPQTARKMVNGAYIEYAVPQGAATGTVASTAYSKISDNGGCGCESF